MFNVGDLVQLNYSHHIGIVIRKTELDEAVSTAVYSYLIKWAVGEPFTWETDKSLILKAGVNNV